MGFFEVMYLPVTAKEWQHKSSTVYPREDELLARGKNSDNLAFQFSSNVTAFAYSHFPICFSVPLPLQTATSRLLLTSISQFLELNTQRLLTAQTAVVLCTHGQQCRSDRFRYSISLALCFKKFLGYHQILQERQTCTAMSGDGKPGTF